MKNIDAAALTLSVIFALKHMSVVEADIQCYKCLVAIPMYYTTDPILLCKDFDYSDKFIVNCPYSTFCHKKIIRGNFSDQIVRTERNCASQKVEKQKYYDDSWHTEFAVEDLYEEGCTTVNDKGARTTTTVNCYCEGELCNSSTTPGGSRKYILFAVIGLVFRTLYSSQCVNYG